MDTGTMHPSQRKKMEEIAKDENNRVLKWEWDHVDRVRSAQEVRALYEDTQDTYVDFLKADSSVTDEVIRAKMMADNEKFASFNKTHPMLFEKATTRPPVEPDADDPDYRTKYREYENAMNDYKQSKRIVYFMLEMRARVERGELTQIQASQLVQAHNIQSCKTGESYEAYQKRMNAGK